MLRRETMLEHVSRIVAAVKVPVTADLEAWYGDTADDVGDTVATHRLNLRGRTRRSSGRAAVSVMTETRRHQAVGRSSFRI